MNKPFELIYSQQSTDYLPGRAYSNPRFFTTPRMGVAKVWLVGDWPKIREAYEAAGVPVEQIDEGLVRGGGKPPSPEAPASLAPVVADRATVEIPENWAELPWTKPAGTPCLRALAALLSDTPVLNKDQAKTAIEAELARRANALLDHYVAAVTQPAAEPVVLVGRSLSEPAETDEPAGE